jgi:hypothetical protein
VKVLVGTKSDLRSNIEVTQALASKGQSNVDPSEAESVARKIGAVKYVECSALTQEGLKV